MSEALDLPDRQSAATSTQVGAIGECLVAAWILEASGGWLSFFKTIADDDGMDLLLFDKVTRRAIPLQIKTRRAFDDERAQTVQFDVRLKTYAAEGEGYILYVKLDGVGIGTLWLVPTKDLPSVARRSSKDFTIVPSAKPTSKDRLSPYRTTSMQDVAARIIAAPTG